MNTDEIREMKISYVPKHRPVIKIRSSREIYEKVIGLYDREEIALKESFWVIALNRANNIIGAKKLSEGSSCGTVVCIRAIAQIALLSNATGIILSHNHPSGNTRPSEEDNKITKSIKEGLKLLSISVLDHIIVTPWEDNGYYSYADEGLI